MNRSAKLGGSASQVRLPEGAKILSPQKVNLVNERSFKPNTLASPNQFESAMSKTPRPKAHKPETLDANNIYGYLEQANQPDQKNQSNGYSRAQTTYSKSQGQFARPNTSGDAFGIQKSHSPRTFQINNGQNPHSKYKKLSSIHPNAGSGALFNPNTVDMEGFGETTKEDREAVEDLERWDNEFRILASTLLLL